MAEPFVYPAGLVTGGAWTEGDVMVAAGEQGRFQTSAAVPTSSVGFGTIDTSTDDVVAATASAEVNFTGSNITITGNNTTKTVDFALTDPKVPVDGTKNITGALAVSTTVTAGTGITATTGNIAASSGNVSASGTVTGSNLSGTNTGDQNIFSTIACTSGTNPVADTTSDTLNLAAGTGITITGDETTDTITIANTVTAPTGANPTATAGQAAVNGAAATFMRSDGAPAVSTIYPSWTKYTVGFGDFTPGGAVNTYAIELLSLPARGVIHGVVIKQSAPFDGAAFTAATLSVGIVGNLTKYAGAFDVFQAAGATVFQLSSTVGAENFGAVTSIQVNIDLGGTDEVGDLTAGSADIFVLTSVTPALTP